MNWEDMTLSDVRRLLRAIEQSSNNPQAVQAIIDRVPVEAMPHGRVTLGTVVRLLDQLHNSTVLPKDMQAFLVFTQVTRTVASFVVAASIAAADTMEHWAKKMKKMWQEHRQKKHETHTF